MIKNTGIPPLFRASALAIGSLALAPQGACADEPTPPQTPAMSWSATAGVATRYISRGLDLTNGPLVPAASAEYRVAGGRYGALQYDLGAYDYYFPGRVGAKVRTKEIGLR